MQMRNNATNSTPSKQSEREMGLKGKLVSQTQVKCERDLFNLYQFPHQLPQIMPHNIPSVDLISGHWGTAGSVVLRTYNIGGEKSAAKDIVEDIGEKKKWIVYKVIEGDLMKYYKAFKLILQVEEDNMVTWTIEYEKKNQSVSDPTAVLDLLLIALATILHS